VTDDSTPEPQPTPEGPSSEVVPGDAADGEAAPGTGFLAHFPRAPIPGTDLTIRSPSVGQDSAIGKDLANEELDDREFTVCLVQRQLDQDLSLGDVRAWTDVQLLAAADAYLSLRTSELGDDEEDDEDVEAGDQAEGEGEVTAAEDDSGATVADTTVEETTVEADAEPEPLTFAAFRDAIRRQGARRAKRFKKTMERILALTNGPMFIAGSRVGDVLKGVDLTAYKTAMNPFAGLDLSKITGVMGSDALRGIDLKGPSGTTTMGDTLKKMMADVQAAQKFTVPSLDLHVPAPDVYRPLHIEPLVRPEIGLLRGVNESLEKMHDDQVRFAQDQLDVMAQQGVLIRDQGEKLEALVSDAKGQKWNRRAMLWFTAIMTIAALAAAFIAGGIIRPFGSTSVVTPAPIVSPQVSSSPAPSLVVTP
jgi:hypothetical protein